MNPNKTTPANGDHKPYAKEHDPIKRTAKRIVHAILFAGHLPADIPGVTTEWLWSVAEGILRTEFPHAIIFPPTPSVPWEDGQMLAEQIIHELMAEHARIATEHTLDIDIIKQGMAKLLHTHIDTIIRETENLYRNDVIEVNKK